MKRRRQVEVQSSFRAGMCFVYYACPNASQVGFAGYQKVSTEPSTTEIFECQLNLTQGTFQTKFTYFQCSIGSSRAIQEAHGRILPTGLDPMESVHRQKNFHQCNSLAAHCCWSLNVSFLPAAHGGPPWPPGAAFQGLFGAGRGKQKSSYL